MRSDVLYADALGGCSDVLYADALGGCVQCYCSIELLCNVLLHCMGSE